MAKQNNKVSNKAAYNKKKRLAKKASSTLFTVPATFFKPWELAPLAANHPAMLAGINAKVAGSMQLVEGIQIEDLPTVKHIMEHWDLTNDICGKYDDADPFKRFEVIATTLFTKEAMNHLAIDLDAILDIVKRDGNDFRGELTGQAVRDAAMIKDGVAGFVAMTIAVAMQYFHSGSVKIAA
jgi:hypothetical protein